MRDQKDEIFQLTNTNPLYLSSLPNPFNSDLFGGNSFGSLPTIPAPLGTGLSSHLSIVPNLLSGNSSESNYLPPVNKSKPKFDEAISLPKKSDEIANPEPENFCEKSLERDAKRNAHTRKENFRQHLERANTVLFWVLISWVTAGTCVWFFHMLTPDKYHFLTTAQLDPIKTIFFTALATNFVKEYYKNHM